MQGTARACATPRCAPGIGRRRGTHAGRSSSARRDRRAAIAWPHRATRRSFAPPRPPRGAPLPLPEPARRARSDTHGRARLAPTSGRPAGEGPRARRAGACTTAGSAPPTRGRGTRPRRHPAAPPTTRNGSARGGCVGSWGRRTGCGRSGRCGRRREAASASRAPATNGSPAPDTRVNPPGRRPPRPSRRRRPGSPRRRPPSARQSRRRTGGFGGCPTGSDAETRAPGWSSRCSSGRTSAGRRASTAAGTRRRPPRPRSARLRTLAGRPR